MSRNAPGENIVCVTVQSRIGGVSGQASVEFVAVLPVLAVAVACAWQVVVAGHAMWTVAEAARVAAREYAVQRRHGDLPAARSRAGRAADQMLPASMRDGRRIAFTSAGAVRLWARVPLSPPFDTVFGRGPAIDSRVGFQQ